MGKCEECEGTGKVECTLAGVRWVMDNYINTDITGVFGWSPYEERN